MSMLPPGSLQILWGDATLSGALWNGTTIPFRSK